jgi:hypothetical protein
VRIDYRSFTSFEGESEIKNREKPARFSGSLNVLRKRMKSYFRDEQHNAVPEPNRHDCHRILLTFNVSRSVVLLQKIVCGSENVWSDTGDCTCHGHTASCTKAVMHNT